MPTRTLTALIILVAIICIFLMCVSLYFRDPWNLFPSTKIFERASNYEVDPILMIFYHISQPFIGNLDNVHDLNCTKGKKKSIQWMYKTSKEQPLPPSFAFNRRRGGSTICRDEKITLNDGSWRVCNSDRISNGRFPNDTLQQRRRGFASILFVFCWTYCVMTLSSFPGPLISQQVPIVLRLAHGYTHTRVV